MNQGIKSVVENGGAELGAAEAGWRRLGARRAPVSMFLGGTLRINVGDAECAEPRVRQSHFAGDSDE
ncbi:hypothetical protein KM043_010057 [Ampulex compressa]|nr:hypothetical protein KM043_010057 [Ampulex compressa]